MSRALEVIENHCPFYIDILIALRKRDRKCIKHPPYPISNFMSFENYSLAHKKFLTNLNTIFISKHYLRL